jgi:membrane associated rhomboid family serine protease
MVPAPVGFQCPACVADAAFQRPPAGGRPPAAPVPSPGPGQTEGQTWRQMGRQDAAARRRSSAVAGSDRSYPVTTALIGVNLVAYVATAMVGANEVFLRYGLLGIGVASGEEYRLLTATVLHAGLTHLAFNMFALWFLGSALEPMLGSTRFAAVYLLSALGGAVVSYAFSSPFIPSVGASGAVFGLLGSIYVALRRQQRDVTSITVVLAINVVLGFVVDGIDWRAHLGGLITGGLVTMAVTHAPRGRQTLALLGATIVTLGVSFLLVTWRTNDLVGGFL